MNKNAFQGDEILMNPFSKIPKNVSRFLILTFCFSLALCSCTTSNNNISDHSVYLDDAEEENEAAIKECHLIIPSDSSDELIKSAKRLSLSLAQRSGVKSTVYYDSEPLPESRNARLIFLGNTCYDISILKISRLKKDDYICTSVESNIVLGGKSSSATVAAIERFISEVLPYFDIQSPISDELSFEYRGEYLYENITVNGYSLDDYTIVYPWAESVKEKSIAHALRENLAALCGAYPNIAESRYVAGAERIICVGACLGDTAPEAQVLFSGSNIILCGSSANLIAESAEHFIELCAADNTLEIIGRSTPQSQISTVTLAAEFPTEIRGDDDLANFSELCKRIKQSLPTIVCFDLPSDTELTKLRKNLTEYSYLGNGLFILSEAYTKISVAKIPCGISADVSLCKSYRCRVIAADADLCSWDTIAASISNDIPTVIFTFNDSVGAPIPFDSREILSEENSSESRSILIKVLAPNGSAEKHGDSAIIIAHPLSR